MRQTLCRPQAGMLLRGFASKTPSPLPSSPKTTKKLLQAESGKGRLLHWSEEKKRLKALPEVWGEGSSFHCRGGGAAGEMETHNLKKAARESMSGRRATMPGFKS